MAETEKKMVKKHMIGLWIDKSADGSLDWLRVKKSEEMDLALNPETVERDYIVDEFPTQEIDKYKPTLNQSLTMYKGEPDYEALFPMGYSLLTGAAAKRNVLIVFMQEPVMGEDNGDPVLLGYKAWKTEATLSFSNINGKESKLTFDINFGGTIEKGYATPDNATKKPVFTKTENDSEGWVDPFGGN